MPWVTPISRRKASQAGPNRATTRKAFQPYVTHLPCGSYGAAYRSEEHTSELQSLMRISYAVFCLKKKKNNKINTDYTNTTINIPTSEEKPKHDDTTQIEP